MAGYLNLSARLGPQQVLATAGTSHPALSESQLSNVAPGALCCATRAAYSESRGSAHMHQVLSVALYAIAHPAAKNVALLLTTLLKMGNSLRALLASACAKQQD